MHPHCKKPSRISFRTLKAPSFNKQMVKGHKHTYPSLVDLGDELAWRSSCISWPINCVGPETQFLVTKSQDWSGSIAPEYFCPEDASKKQKHVVCPYWRGFVSPSIGMQWKNKWTCGKAFGMGTSSFPGHLRGHYMHIFSQMNCVLHK